MADVTIETIYRAPYESCRIVRESYIFLILMMWNSRSHLKEVLFLSFCTEPVFWEPFRCQCHHVKEYIYIYNIHISGSVVRQWFALLLHSKVVLGIRLRDRWMGILTSSVNFCSSLNVWPCCELTARPGCSHTSTRGGRDSRMEF